VLALSLLFYAWGSPIDLLFILAACFFDYVISLIITRSGNALFKKYVAGIAIILNLTALGYFKYINFIISELNKIITGIGIQPLSLAAATLPIGMSFITFKKISYLVDRLRGTAKQPNSFSEYLLYVTFFPQVMAGPIVKYYEMAEQINKRSVNVNLVFQGIWRFSIGLGKKVLIADSLGVFANRIFGLEPVVLSVPYAWLGALSYTLQIYFDFSGYSDMAIGLGKMMGFECVENFNFPYISRNITEFWRRWHISFTFWMREYLYIPLGGNRVSSIRLYINLWIVFLLSGLWHGANWTFVLWGAYHGLFITLDKLFWQNIVNKLNKIVSIAITFIIITCGWVLFRSPDINFAMKYYGRMFGLNNMIEPSLPIIWQESITSRGIFIVLVALFFSFIPALNIYNAIRLRITNNLTDSMINGIKLGIILTVYMLSIMSRSISNFNAFIYFTF